MRLTTIVASTILVLGLSTTAYAEAGKCGAGMGKQSMKCGGAMKGNMPFKDKKEICLTKIDTMQKCVNAAKTNEELTACKSAMMGAKKAKGKSAKGKCGSGKCGGK